MTFCQKCRYFQEAFVLPFSGIIEAKCKYKPIKRHDFEKEWYSYHLAASKNSGNNCKDFEERKFLGVF